MAVTKVRASTQLIADSASFTSLSVSTSAASGNDVVNYDTLQQHVIMGRTWREALLHSDQLVDGASGGVRSATVLWAVGNPSAYDTLILKNGSVTETYTFKAIESGAFTVAIGADATETMANLVAAINDDSDATDGWVAVTPTDLSSFTASPALIVMEVASAGGDTSRLYATAGSSLRAINFGSKYDYQYFSAAFNLAGADPAARTFGFGRGHSSLAVGEIHPVLDGVDLPYIWDADGDAWSVIPSTLADGSVTTAKLAADAVTGAKIADAAVDSEHIAAGALDTTHFADNAVTMAKMAMYREAFTGDGATTVFSLAVIPSGASATFVYLNGVLQDEGVGDDFQLADEDITFSAAPANGDKINVLYFQ